MQKKSASCKVTCQKPRTRTVKLYGAHQAPHDSQTESLTSIGMEPTNVPLGIFSVAVVEHGFTWIAPTLDTVYQWDRIRVGSIAEEDTGQRLEFPFQIRPALALSFSDIHIMDKTYASR